MRYAAAIRSRLRAARGFTIIELMVTLIVFAILVIAIAPSMLTTMRNSQIRSVASAWRDGLAQARIEAIRRNLKVTFVPTGADWDLQAMDPVTGNLITVATYRSGANVARVVQIGLTAGANAAYNGTGRMVPLNGSFVARFTPASGTCVAGGGDVRCLSVEATGGYVRTCDPAAVAPSPLACSAGG
jgi:type IV fimbrial biogenesis protein FimT